MFEQLSLTANNWIGPLVTYGEELGAMDWRDYKGGSKCSYLNTS